MNVQTHEERMLHLQMANQARSQRARLKDGLRRGQIPFDAVLTDPIAENMRLVDVLLSVRRIGRVKARKIMMRLGVSPTITVGDLTDRQQAELRKAFR